MLAGFLLAVLGALLPRAHAYEGIVHYAWTYYLALQVGFTERQAYQIGSAANALDWDAQTNPIASPLNSMTSFVDRVAAMVSKETSGRPSSPRFRDSRFRRLQ